MEAEVGIVRTRNVDEEDGIVDSSEKGDFFLWWIEFNETNERIERSAFD